MPIAPVAAEFFSFAAVQNLIQAASDGASAHMLTEDLVPGGHARKGEMRKRVGQSSAQVSQGHAVACVGALGFRCTEEAYNGLER